jgi:hypothetical protein
MIFGGYEYFNNDFRHQLYARQYFWRTVQKQEIDLIEAADGKIAAYEFKWNRQGKRKTPAAFRAHYETEGQFIDRENFREFVRRYPMD